MLRKVITKSKLSELMDIQGWTDKTMAQATGLSASFIYKLKKGRVGCSVSSGMLLCQVLGLTSIHQLFWVEVIDPSPAERLASGQAGTPN